MRAAWMIVAALLVLVGPTAAGSTAAAPERADRSGARWPTYSTMALLRGWVGDDGEWHYQIWRADPTPGIPPKPVQLTADPDLLPYNAELDPTADRVAFSVGFGGTLGQHSLTVMNIDGSKRRNLLAGDGLLSAARNPGWSPDGKRLVFQGVGSSAGSFSHEIWTVDATGKNLRQVTHCDCAIWNTPQWSPVRNEVLWSPHQYDLAILDLDTGRSTQVYDNAPSGHMNVMEYHWSPDGERVVFTASAWNDAEPDVWTINRDGSQLTQVATMAGVSFSNPMYSPDGQYVAVNAARQDSRGDITTDVWWFDPQQTIAAWHAEMGLGGQDELMSWRAGPYGSLNPGGRWSQITAQHMEGGDFVYVDGGLMPGRYGATVHAALQKRVKKRGSFVWRTVRTAKATTTGLSTYAVTLRRTSGLCRVTVSWPGDAAAKAASRTTNSFGC